MAEELKFSSAEDLRSAQSIRRRGLRAGDYKPVPLGSQQLGNFSHRYHQGRDRRYTASWLSQASYVLYSLAKL